MKASEVHKLSLDEIAAEEQRLRGQLYELRSQAVTQKIDNPKLMGNIRRDIARLLTERQRRKAPETTKP